MISKRKLYVLSSLIFCYSVTVAQNTILLGRVESLKIMPEKLRIEAKLDTGAYMSSLHADSIQEYDYKGKRWVKFTFKDIRSGKRYEFNKPLLRYVRIKKRSGEIKPGGSIYLTRPMVRLTVCLAGQTKQVDFNLTNRAHFKQKLLFGRKSMQKFSVIVNPSKEYLTLPNCL